MPINQQVVCESEWKNENKTHSKPSKHIFFSCISFDCEWHFCLWVEQSSIGRIWMETWILPNAHSVRNNNKICVETSKTHVQSVNWIAFSAKQEPNIHCFWLPFRLFGVCCVCKWIDVAWSKARVQRVYVQLCSNLTSGVSSVLCGGKWNKKRECALACRCSACVHNIFIFFVDSIYFCTESSSSPSLPSSSAAAVARPSTHIYRDLKNWLFFRTHTEAKREKRARARDRERESSRSSETNNNKINK